MIGFEAFLKTSVFNANEAVSSKKKSLRVALRTAIDCEKLPNHYISMPLSKSCQEDTTFLLLTKLTLLKEYA